MDSSQWLPIMGVVIGWFLSELSWYYRVSREERRALSKALTTFLYIYFDRLRYRMILEVVNERMGSRLKEIHSQHGFSERGVAEAAAVMKALEGARKVMSYDPKATTERTAASLRGALDDLSAADAILALKARQVLEDHEFFLATDLEPLLTDPRKYVHVYGSMLAAHDQYAAELKRIALAVAWRIGMVMWLRTLWTIRSDRNLSTERKKMINKTFEEMESSEKSRAADAQQDARPSDAASR